MTVDVTAPRKSFTDDELEGLLARRASIEQAKGMLMLAYGVDGEAAFRMLREISQAQNLKLYDVAEVLVAALAAGGMDVVSMRREVGDRAFLQLYLPHTGTPDPAEPHYDIQETRRPGGVRIVEASGVVDLAAAPELRRVIVKSLATAKNVAVDLVGVDELDGVVATMIVRFERKIAKDKFKGLAVAATGSVRAMLEAVAEGPLQVYPTRHEALKACQ